MSVPRVSHVECIHLRFLYDPERTFVTPGGPVHGRLCTLVRVHTDDGRTGIGSAYAHPGLVQVAVDHFTPFVVGANPRSPEKIWARLHAVSNWFGRKGAAVTAIGGIDQALWDLKGQMEGEPVWRLLGGTDPAVPAYASGMLYSSPDDVAEKAAACVARGFRQVKMRVGYSWDYDEAAVRLAREAIGPDVDLMTDGTRRFDLPTAIAFSNRVLVPAGAFWFEEPFHPDDIDLLAALRAETTVPVATGESEVAFHGFRDIMRIDAADIVQADVSRCGGITEAVMIARHAAERGVRYAPHTWCDPVGIIANAHVVAAMPNGLTVEIDQTGNRFVEELLGAPVLPGPDGRLSLGDRPGLGVDLDDDVVAELRVDDPFAIPDGNYCDVIYGWGQVQLIPEYEGPITPTRATYAAVLDQ